MLKHLFGRSASTSATVKKKGQDSQKGSRKNSLDKTEKCMSVLPPNSKSEVLKDQQFDAKMESYDGKPVTAYGYEDSSADDDALDAGTNSVVEDKYKNQYVKNYDRQTPLDEFTDSPKGLNITQAKSEVTQNKMKMSMSNTIVFNKNAFPDMPNPNLNKTNTNNPRFNDSPSFVESSITPVDVSLSQINDQKLMLNDFTKFHGESMNEYMDKAKRSRDNSFSKMDSPGKIVRSADGTPIKMHLDLSSILRKREEEQKGKQLYRISRSNSKSPATTTGNGQKSKAMQKLNQLKQNSLGNGEVAGDKFNLNNIAKNNIKDKKYNELRDQIASGIEKQVKKKKEEDHTKQPKRRTKEERDTNAKNSDNYANTLIKKQTKINYSVNINLTPKRNDLDNKSNSFVVPQNKEKISPTRPSLVERSRIKPYQKNSDITQASKLDYSDPIQVQKAFNQAMVQTIEKNKKKEKAKKKVNIVDDGYNSPTSKISKNDMTSEYRSSIKKTQKNKNYDTPKKSVQSGVNVRNNNSIMKQSNNYIIGQPSVIYPYRDKLKEEKDRQQLNHVEKKKNISSNLYYGVVTKKADSKSTKQLKKSAQKELKERQKKAAQDRANRPWNLNQSYISQLSMSPQRRFLRKGTSVSKSRASLMQSTIGRKSPPKKYKPGQFGTKSQFGAMGRSFMATSANRYGFQNNLAGRLKRSSTISTFQPKFGRSTIAHKGKLSFGLGGKEQEQDPNFRKSLEWRKEVAAKYNNLMRFSKSPSPVKKTKQVNKSISSPMKQRKTMTKRNDSSLSVTQHALNKDWSTPNIHLSSKRKVSIKAKLQMLKDDDLLPDQDLYKFPTIGQISKMSPIGPINEDPINTKNIKKKRSRFDNSKGSQDFSNNLTGQDFQPMMNSISQGNLDKDDIIIEEPKSSAGQDEKKKSISSAEATPVIHSGKFESQRNTTEGVQLISPLKNAEQNHLNTIEQKPLASMDFLESLKTNQYYNKPIYSRSFADVAIEQKKKEDEDLFNNLMAGDGKQDSNRMALADNDNDQAKSKRTQNSGLGYNSLNHSVQNTSKFGDDPPHSPNFKGDNIFKESPIDKFEKHEHISEVPTLDNLDNKSSNGEKQSKIDELKQKQRESRNRLDERRSRRQTGSKSPQRMKDSNSVEVINFNPPERHNTGEDQTHEQKSDEPMAQVSINDISFSEQVIDDDVASSKHSDIDRFSSKRVNRNLMSALSGHSSQKGSTSGGIHPAIAKRLSKPTNDPMTGGPTSYTTSPIYNSFTGTQSALNFSSTKFNSLTPQTDGLDIKFKNQRIQQQQ